MGGGSAIGSPATIRDANGRVVNSGGGGEARQREHFQALPAFVRVRLLGATPQGWVVIELVRQAVKFGS